MLSPNEGKNRVVQESTKVRITLAGGDKFVEPGVMENSSVADIVQCKLGVRGIWDDSRNNTRLPKQRISTYSLSNDAFLHRR